MGWVGKRCRLGERSVRGLRSRAKRARAPSRHRSGVKQFQAVKSTLVTKLESRRSERTVERTWRGVGGQAVPAG